MQNLPAHRVYAGSPARATQIGMIVRSPDSEGTVRSRADSRADPIVFRWDEFKADSELLTLSWWLTSAHY
jgi:hypothetical protein